MVQIGEAMNGKIGFSWDAGFHMTMGSALYAKALEIMNLYDDDFRPRPRREQVIEAASSDGDGTILHVFYLPHRREYDVVVSLGDRELTETIPAVHVPRFGIDASDLDAIYAVAERLADTLLAKGTS